MVAGGGNPTGRVRDLPIQRKKSERLTSQGRKGQSLLKSTESGRAGQEKNAGKSSRGGPGAPTLGKRKQFRKKHKVLKVARTQREGGKGIRSDSEKHIYTEEQGRQKIARRPRKHAPVRQQRKEKVGQGRVDSAFARLHRRNQRTIKKGDTLEARKTIIVAEGPRGSKRRDAKAGRKGQTRGPTGLFASRGWGCARAAVIYAARRKYTNSMRG